MEPKRQGRFGLFSTMHKADGSDYEELFDDIKSDCPA